MNIEISVVGEASIKDNKVVVDCSELKKLAESHANLLEALIDLQADIGGGRKFCGHDFTCRCAWEKATKAIKEAE